LKRWLVAWVFGAVTTCVSAAELADITARLTAPMGEGSFVQEKKLRSLPLPLVSRGHFTVASGLVLWETESPFISSLRISADGVSQWEQGEQVWQVSAAEQPLVATVGRLLIALLAGDVAAMTRFFNLQSATLQGDDCWRAELLVRDAILADFIGSVNIQGCAAIEQLELREVGGDITQIQLSPAP
jgi:hypothetical protein